MKVSFQNRINDKKGTFYRQRVKIDKKTFDKLRDIVESEISLNYPNRLKYTFTDTDTMYLNRLYAENNICFLNLTTLRFLSRYLNNTRIILNINTYLYIK